MRPIVTHFCFGDLCGDIESYNNEKNNKKCIVAAKFIWDTLLAPFVIFLR